MRRTAAKSSPRAHSVAGPEALCDLLGLSPAGLAEFGWVSQMAAAQAGYALCDTYEGWWGVAVLGDMQSADDVYGQQVGETWVAVATPSMTEVRHYPYGGQGTLAPGWVTLRVLDLLRRLALQRIAERDAAERAEPGPCS